MLLIVDISGLDDCQWPTAVVIPIFIIWPPFITKWGDTFNIPTVVLKDIQQL